MAAAMQCALRNDILDIAEIRASLLAVDEFSSQSARLCGSANGKCRHFAPGISPARASNPAFSQPLHSYHFSHQVAGSSFGCTIEQAPVRRETHFCYRTVLVL